MSAAQEQQTEFKKPFKLPMFQKLVVGAIAGIIGTVAIFPIDMVKTRLQQQTIGPNGERAYRGPFHCMSKIIRVEGLRGLYKGLGPNLVGVTPEKAIKLAVNEYARELLENPDGSIDLHNEIIAGASAGFFQVIATNPMELIKIRMQTQATLPVEQRQSAVEVVRGLGVRGMYTGATACFVRDIPFSLLFFPGYSHLKTTFAEPDGETKLPGVLAAGAIAGALSSGLCTPADVVKTRLQLKGGRAKYGGMVQCTRIIWRDEGFMAFYKGVVPRMSVVAPLFGIALVSFELTKDYMLKQQAARFDNN